MRSNQSFYREIAGYRMSVGDHRVARIYKGVMGQQYNSYMTLNWGALDHASHAPQLMS